MTRHSYMLCCICCGVPQPNFCIPPCLRVTATCLQPFELQCPRLRARHESRDNGCLTDGRPKNRCGSDEPEVRFTATFHSRSPCVPAHICVHDVAAKKPTLLRLLCTRSPATGPDTIHPQQAAPVPSVSCCPPATSSQHHLPNRHDVYHIKQLLCPFCAVKLHILSFVTSTFNWQGAAFGARPTATCNCS